jgi:hypothetical protein
MRFIGIFVLALVPVISGCELLGMLGGGGVCPGAEDSQGTMSADVEGAGFDACLVVGDFSSGTLTVTGQHYDNAVPEQLQIVVLEAAVGTFALGTADGHSGRYTDSEQNTYTPILDTDTGTIEITAIDDTMAAGTFSYTATGGAPGGGDASQVTVENGSFEISFD